MKRHHLLSLALLLPLAGCWSAPVVQEKPLPFVFRSLNLRQQDSKGRPAWELRSPEARYDMTARLAFAREPQGVIYANGQARYRVQAAKGTVFNDGEQITLEQGVRIEVISNRPVLITGDRVRWIPRQKLMEIDRRPVAFDQQSRLSATNARFRLDLDRIELRGQPRLERWEGTSKPQGQRQGPPQTVLKLTKADWNPGSGNLQGSGPVRGERQGRKGSSQVLTASALVGNTRQQWLDFQKPVRLTDRAQKAALEAGPSRWEFGSQRISSTVPFTAVIGQLHIRGAAFEILQKEQIVHVPQACDLRQPGEWLQAQVCRWNWTTQAFNASGRVVMRRTANRQLTRSSEVNGSLGEKGLAVFTTPGGRVSSRLELPPKAPQQRPSAPVTF
ncbi:LPS export ABC transporter periplasmic protein LptC [Cyanobium sp. ATX 6F1]|uniref:LPS export ABC transporter periplasmic protein LptC n=1 Tax=unclassified Cyanobium TaxID=2627006 RepID=UPI0020CDDB0F|nr:LPS export ABC transporter periplasmic protein LptC [Cyanobium sp. ATX 6F1]MCP9916097.1 LPS export ABC transporter periplasmic protein LptC [Cyanobium sp. ATX 6F1]